MGININYFHNNINILSMNKLTSFEKLQADEVLRLELAYSNLYQAYVLGDTEEMKNRYVAAMDINIPFLANSVYSKTMQIMQQNKILPKFEDIRNINDETILRMNIKGCLDALQEEMNIRNIYQNHYIYAQSILFQPNHIFTQDEVLYQDSQGQQLKVADLLKVSKYAISIAEAIAPENKEFTTANAAITTFQGIDAILNLKTNL